MHQTASARIKIDQRECELRFDACRVMRGGEFAGNIELDVSCDPDIVGPVMEGLRVQAPGKPPSDTALGNGRYAAGTHLVFWTEPSNLGPELPSEITLLWGETPIASIAPTPDEQVPLEEVVEWTEPSQILDTFPTPTSNFVLLAANREKLWFLLAGFEIMSGLFIALALPAFEVWSPELCWFVGGGFIATGIAVGAVLGWMPHEQIWLDRDARRVLIVRGRTSDPHSKFADAPSRPLDEFHHVRLFQRWSISTDIDTDDQVVWFVTLEGPIAHAGSDGRVHLHDDALPIIETSSESEARRIAAIVAYHTGLKILDTGHDQTA